MRPPVQPTLLLYAVLAGTIPAGTPTESERQLVAILRSNAPLYERVQARRQLARIGGANSVAPLAAVLPDDKLSAYAREALEAIPLPAATQALRDALPRLQGDLLSGVINSLAARRDEQAVHPLSALVRDSNPEIAAAALIALGRVGTAPAIELLQETMARGTPECREAAAEGCLLAAQQHWRGGEADRAAPLYDAVRRAPLAAQLRATATRGAILARRVAGLALLLEQLHSGEDALRDAALAAARELPDPAVTTALMAELDTGDPTRQVLLTGALVDRGGAGVRAALEKKINAPSEEVRVATLQALGDADGDSTVPLLLATIGASSAREAGAAFQSLSRINAGNVQAAILQFLPSASPPLAARLISVIGERNDPGAADELLKLARHPEPDISTAALRALANWPSAAPCLTLMAAAAIVLVLFLRAPEATLSSRTSPAAPLLPLAGQQTLPDGSSAELNRGAAVDLRYTDRERRVLLREGEAHFIVTKNDPRPFVVTARSIDVRAVGTAFNVRVDAGVVEVLVTEGRVRVDAAPAGGPEPAPRRGASAPAPLIPVLTARQRAVVSLAPQLEPPRIATLTAVEIDRMLAWQHRLLHFTDAPLSEIVAEFNRRNRVQLILLEPELAAVHLTVTFRSDNVDGFVHLLEAGFALQAEHRGEADIILRKGPARERRP